MAGSRPAPSPGGRNALAQGEEDPKVLAEYAEGRLRAKHDDLLLALHGRVSAHQREMLRLQPAHVAFLDGKIAQLDTRVAGCLGPHEQEIERLCTIPGVSQRVAQVILAAVGTDMARFPSADHLVSWAGMCPGNNEGGGKRRPARSRHGNEPLAGRSKETHLGATYRLLAARRGGKRAAIALGRHILPTPHFILRDGTTCRELGANCRDQRRKEAVKRGAIARLKRVGFSVRVEPLTA